MSDMDALAKNLKLVNENLKLAYDRFLSNSVNKTSKSGPPRLVAVSKTKPVEAVLAAYALGQRHFGENYVNELIEKANDQRLVEQCPEIRWHFIGNLQSNKINKICSQVKRLYAIETLDSNKSADFLNKAVEKFRADKIINVFVQVNTSGEEQKSGINVEEAGNLANFVKNSCPYLNFMGFMTIGSIEQSLKSDGSGPNQDFQNLVDVRKKWCQSNGVDEFNVELSMGMSGDYETAIEMGSTNVRIGSTIFGSRDYSK